MVLGYPFLAKHQPEIDWVKRRLFFFKEGQSLLVQGYPVPQTVPDGDRECPFTPLSQLPGVQWTTPMVIPQLPTEKKLPSKPVLSVKTISPKHAVSLPVTMIPTVPEFVIPTSLEALMAYEAEAIDPTPEDIAELQESPVTLSYPSGQPLRFKRRSKKNSPRSKVQVDLKDIDHTICGPACKEIPIPNEVLTLNKEYQKLFPEKMPAGLPPARITDHHITLKPNSRAPAQRLYRLNP